MKSNSLAAATLGTLVMSASGQSFNIDWGSPGTAPSSSYAAEGLAGTWNTFNAMPAFQRFPLVGLDGSPIAADIMNIGFDVIESEENPATSGDDEALLDDCFTSFNDPVDGCLFIRFMQPGEYKVIMYAMAPDDGALLNRLRIDQNTEDPEMVGGVWSGSHENGISYMTQFATVGIDGRLDMHSGLPGANIRSVLNGIQVIAVDDLCMPNINNDGSLDFFDISAFLSAYSAMDPAADFASDGVFDFFDISAFLTQFSAGCP